MTGTPQEKIGKLAASMLIFSIIALIDFIKVIKKLCQTIYSK